MAKELPGFKRLVLGLQPSSPDRTMRFAVDLANTLRLDLLGLFLDDTSLRDLAQIPIAREFRPLKGGWQTIDLDQLSHELEAAARKSERIFFEAVKQLSTSCRFEVVKGPTATTIAQVSRNDDIVMVVEPASPAERATQQFAWLTEAAFRSASAVIFVPPLIARRTGPVVAIAAAADDPSIQAAAMIAAAAREELVIVGPSGGTLDEGMIRDIAGHAGLVIRRVTSDLPLSDPAFGSDALRDFRECLIVLTRGALSNERAMVVAASRGVPVLVVV